MSSTKALLQRAHMTMTTFWLTVQWQFLLLAANKWWKMWGLPTREGKTSSLPLVAEFRINHRFWPSVLLNRPRTKKNPYSTPLTETQYSDCIHSGLNHSARARWHWDTLFWFPKGCREESIFSLIGLFVSHGSYVCKVNYGKIWAATCQRQIVRHCCKYVHAWKHLNGRSLSCSDTLKPKFIWRQLWCVHRKKQQKITD